MAGSVFSRRRVRTLLLLTGAGSALFFVFLNVSYMFFAALDHRSIAGENAKQHESEIARRDDEETPKTQRIAIQISNIEADVDGNVNIQLSLKVQELLKFLEGETELNGEATNHAPPGIVQYLVNNPNVCDDNKNLKYIVYVHTSPDHEKRRELLRSTWASTSLFQNHPIERVFLMGRSKDAKIQDRILKEAETHHDIVQGDFIDEYRNLTLKGLMGLRWVSEFCPNAKFAIKADDDAFVDIFKLMDFLESQSRQEKLLACPLWGDNSMPILRDPAKCAKWCVKYNEFPGKRYFPKYCAGLSFIFSMDLVPLLFKASKTTPFFWIDDVYITGLLPMKVPGVEFMSLSRNFTLKQQEAIDDLNAENKPYTKLFVHAKELDKFPKMWTMLLKRLDPRELKRLTTEAIEKHGVLKAKLENH